MDQTDNLTEGISYTRKWKDKIYCYNIIELDSEFIKLKIQYCSEYCSGMPDSIEITIPTHHIGVLYNMLIQSGILESGNVF